MGLDIYLYKYENKPETDRLEKEYDTISSKRWNDAGDYKSLTEEIKNELRGKDDELAKSLGLSKYGEDEVNKIKIEFDSSIDKDHYFKVGYFRSSYNESGINRILRNLNVPDLQYIFNPQEEYSFEPDWSSSLERCNEAISILESKGNYRCFQVSANIFGQPTCTSEKEAIDVFMKETARGGGDYSNINGEFYLSTPLKVLALVQGTSKIFNPVPCTYVICEGENDWYIKALKIVKETIEYVLNQPDKQKYFLHWSS
jgi:hypothetical protein